MSFKSVWMEFTGSELKFENSKFYSALWTFNAALTPAWSTKRKFCFNKIQVSVTDYFISFIEAPLRKAERVILTKKSSNRRPWRLILLLYFIGNNPFSQSQFQLCIIRVHSSSGRKLSITTARLPRKISGGRAGMFLAHLWQWKMIAS